MLIRKYLPALVCGFGAAVMTTIPGLRSVACCLIVPAAAAFSLVLHKRIDNVEEPIRVDKGLVFGLLTGVIAALFASSFDVLMTYITRTNEFIESLPQSESVMRDWDLGPMLKESMEFLRGVAKDVRENGFSIIYTGLIFFSNIITYSIFGIIGGMLSTLFINKRS